MWGLLRIILLIASAVFLAFVAYYIIDDILRGVPIGAYPIRYGIFILLGLNFIYLLLANQASNWRTSNWRIFRLISLWFDAKESELRQRADRSRRDK